MSGRVYGLIGQTLKHSYSPRLHQALGCADYRLYELEPDRLEAFLRRPDLGGVNVTIPYKLAALALCDSLSPEARDIGSVNTVLRMPDGTLCGYNTDVYGLRHAIRSAGMTLEGRHVLIFGSGGGSKTAQYAARTGGAASVAVISRTGPDNYQTLERHQNAQLLINATPLGMYPNTGALPADPARFPACRGVVDLVYNPCRTALLLRAQALGLPCIDGLEMLTAQAAAAETLFFGDSGQTTQLPRLAAALRRETVNIVLIGMPGSGKTTIGRALSGLTGRTLVDVDEQIQAQTGRTIPELFAQDGEPAFRALEHRMLETWGRERGLIIATGGGAVLDPENYPLLRQNGRIYQLQRELASLAVEGRPLSQQIDLAAMLRQREPLYARFRDAQADNNGAVRDTAAAIWRDFCEHPGA